MEGTDDEVDPRIQIELEKLNNATDVINHLEVDLDEARCTFRNLLTESTARINFLSKKLGSCIEKSRPYYEVRIKAQDDLQRAQKAAVRFERANSSHEASKEMVALAEEGLLMDGRTFDHAWQEMLNHATMRVNEAEKERSKSEEEHRCTSFQYQKTETKVQELQFQLKKSIAKSSRNARRSLLQLTNLAYQHHLLLLPYFEMKAHYNRIMEEQKLKIRQLEEDVARAKFSYANALENLEKISDEIHQSRNEQEEMKLGTRSAGVGADSPDLDSSMEAIGGNKMSFQTMQSTLTDDYFELPDRLKNMGLLPIQKHPPPVEENEFYQVPCQGNNRSPSSGSSITLTHESFDLPLTPPNTLDIPALTISEPMLDKDLTPCTVKAQSNGIYHQYPTQEVVMQTVSPCNVMVEMRKQGTDPLRQPSPEDFESSDCESLTSVEMLSEEQITSLSLEKELDEAAEEILATPVAEETPLIMN